MGMLANTNFCGVDLVFIILHLLSPVVTCCDNVTYLTCICVYTYIYIYTYKISQIYTWSPHNCCIS